MFCQFPITFLTTLWWITATKKKLTSPDLFDLARFIHVLSRQIYLHSVQPFAAARSTNLFGSLHTANPMCKKWQKNCAWHQEPNKKHLHGELGGTGFVIWSHVSTHLLLHRAVFHSGAELFMWICGWFSPTKKDLKFQPTAFGGWKKIWKVNKYK